MSDFCAEAGGGGGLGNVRHVISIHDVVTDTMHQFAPSYHDYVLYSNGGNKEAPKKVRCSCLWQASSLATIILAILLPADSTAVKK